MKATVSEKGQFTIPKKVRDQLGIRPGQVLEVSVEKNAVVARKTPRRSLEAIRGIIESGGMTVDEFLAEIRGPAFDPERDPEQLKD